jgi:hypothetical protein
MSINTTSFTSTDGLEMNTALSNCIPEPESFSDSLCPMRCPLTTRSINGKASNLPLRDKFDSGESKSIHLSFSSFSTCNFITTSRITDIPERNSDLFSMPVNEHKIITQSPPIRQNRGNWRGGKYWSCYTISNRSIGSVHHKTLFPKCTKTMDNDLVHGPPLSANCSASFQAPEF